MLTRKQYELLVLIDQRLKKSGVSPSFDEMKEALDLKSKSGIHRLITALEERGFIRRLPHRARALEVLKLPEAVPTKATRGKFKPSVIQGDFTPSLPPGRPVAESTSAVSLPLYGRIAAGTAIEALRDTSNFVDVPAGLLAKGEHYALEVDGDSMMEAGILNGDTVIIQKADTAENGVIVVALVDENEVTLKRLRRRGNTIALEPANSAYKTQIFGADRVKVQGKLVSLLRKY